MNQPVRKTETFPDALRKNMRAHGDTAYGLHKAITRPGDKLHSKTILFWLSGKRRPRTTKSFEYLGRIEKRYGLPVGYFKNLCPQSGRSANDFKIEGASRAMRRRLAWHLPDDFNDRPRAEREEILAWVQDTVISGTTPYRAWYREAVKDRFAIRFSGSSPLNKPRPGIKMASPELAGEMADLIRFKTATLTEFGYRRSGVWGPETAAQKQEHFGLMLGAMAAAPDGPAKGLGVSPPSLTMALLIFPRVWDWYLQWREARRGFFTAWEVDMLRTSLALTKKETGWLRQRPDLAERLKPVPGLVSATEIAAVQADWAGACERYHKHASQRVKEIERVAQVHRNPFEPVMAILEADSPLGEYKKIAEEIIRYLPDEQYYPKAAAEAVRAILMIRLGLHLGLRQKNLRQLMLCPRGQAHTPERQLATSKRGELRWSEKDNGWEAFIPSVAFKNAGSSYFGSNPFRLLLPDLGDLYHYIETYIARHRRLLLGKAEDPGTFFIKTVKATTTDPSYSQNSFYEAWRLIIQRYGIFNPYTGRGAIKGLLPHGPHNVRDVLATHILKKTGSYEQASYAIQDTPETVAQHYGRFLPQDKAALAAQILNKVWETG